jgi:hypothetical protein
VTTMRSVFSTPSAATSSAGQAQQAIKASLLPCRAGWGRLHSPAVHDKQGKQAQDQPWQRGRTVKQALVPGQGGRIGAAKLGAQRGSYRPRVHKQGERVEVEALDARNALVAGAAEGCGNTVDDTRCTFAPRVCINRRACAGGLQLYCSLVAARLQTGILILVVRRRQARTQRR